MAAPDLGERMRRSFRRFVRKWESVQVELHGRYSLQRFTAMNDYNLSTSFWRALIMLPLTLVPSLALVAMIDAVPLKSLEEGFSQSTIAWIRATVTCFIYTHCSIEQIRLYSPNLNLQPSAALYISLPAAICTNALALALSALICWPLPFANVLMSGPWLGFTTLFLLKVRGAHMRANPESVKDVVRFATICGSQISMVLIYAVFNTIFTNMSPTYQPVFALLIPVFKMLQKNMLSRILNGLDDTKPQVVIFNVEIFNALFISSCMQNSRSIGTSITLITVDLLQAAISFNDLKLLINDVKRILDKMGVNTTELIATAALIVEKNSTGITPNNQPAFHIKSSHVWAISTFPSLAAITPKSKQVAPTMRTQFSEDELPVLRSTLQKQGTKKSTLFSAGSTTKVVALSLPDSVVREPDDLAAALACITPEEHQRLLKKALQVLFLTEYLLLIEFTEVLIPVLYGWYLAILFHLPNRRFYPQLAHLTDAELWAMVTSVLTYGALEFGSLVLLVGLLYRVVHRHPLQQLAFVLEREFLMVQPKLVLWVIMTLQSTLPHLGADYTFQFKWLRGNK